MTAIRDYIATARVFDQNGTAGNYVAVLSYGHGLTRDLRSPQPLTQRVLADAKARHERYMENMAGANRRALPTETVYYAWDRATGTVLGLITADGTVELASDFRTPQQASSIAAGFQAMRDSGAYRAHTGE